VSRAVTVDDALAWPARFRLDGTGRAGILARRMAGRRLTSPHRTVALSAVWEAGRPWPVPDTAHTLVEGYRDGWAWSVPAGGNRRVVAVMVDPQVSDLRRGTGAHEVYRHELAKTREFQRLVAGAQMVHEPTGWDASEYCATDYAGSDWLVMGDAATFVDPLSSSGVKKALTSGWLAAVTVHTSLLDPSRARLARGFFAEREQEMFDRLRQLTRQFLTAGTPETGGAFWHDRAAADERPAVDDRAAIEDAWERIRTADRLQLVPGQVTWTERPAVRGTEIVPEWRLMSPEDPAGVRYVHDVDIRALIEIAPQFQEVPGLYSAYCRHAGPVGWPALLTALATSVARGWLKWADAPVVNAHDTATR
jgi:flavin-dependent dehydrogenase